MVGDATKLDAHFPGQQFDCICTHFVTGYVAMRVLGPEIASRLKPGGYWSLVGGTKAAYPALQAKGDSKLLRWLSGAGSRKMDDTVLNPGELARSRRARWTHRDLKPRSGRDIRADARSSTNFDQFMEFGYRGGWLTPLIETMGLHRAGPMKRWLLNHLAFPVKDSHNIVIALGRKQ